jgi:sodium-dependent phosphate cotransporter
VAVFLVSIYVFLAAIELFGSGMKLLGKETAEQLFGGLQNPFAGLAVGILATVLVQSSSVTTSTIVAMVGSGTLRLEYAVPMVMGANIGTSITNTLVSLGHVTQNTAFRRAFAGATVHDFFNFLTVVILLPIELTTGYLQYSATWLVEHLRLEGTGGEFHSPIKAAVKWLVQLTRDFLEQTVGIEDKRLLAAVFFVLAVVMIIGSLVFITKNMKALMADRIEQWLNRVLRRSGLLGLAIGAVTTALVQSSSITTSLLVPIFGAGVLTLEAGLPIMIGANIGTTITALLAATVTGPLGLTIALVHLLFNLSGTLIFFPFMPIRRIPARLAEGLAAMAVRNRLWVLAYIIGVFVILPILGVLIWK